MLVKILPIENVSVFSRIKWISWSELSTPNNQTSGIKAQSLIILLSKRHKTDTLYDPWSINSVQLQTHLPCILRCAMRSKTIFGNWKPFKSDEKCCCWWWWWIVFMVWLTDERRLALFLAGTFVRDPHHLESLTRRK